MNPLKEFDDFLELRRELFDRCSDAEGEDKEKMGFGEVILSIVMGLRKNNLGNCEENGRGLRNRAIEWWKRWEWGILVEINMDIDFPIHNRRINWWA